MVRTELEQKLPIASRRGNRFDDPVELREEIRAGRFRETTAGQAPGYVQTNLVVLPRDLAFDFLVFAQRNPKSCPLVEVLEPGDPAPHLTAPGADIRTDVPSYRIYRDGELADEVADIRESWTHESVAFLLGCSFTFEEALVSAGISLRHHELGRTVPMYRTAIATRPAGPFRGRMVVSMRPVPAFLVSRAVQVTARFPLAHGAPVHVGDPAAIGIERLDEPDYGDAVPVGDDEVPVFWACGVTPQSVALDSRPASMVTHSPGRMFVTDVRHRELDVLGGGFLS